MRFRFAFTAAAAAILLAAARTPPARAVSADSSYAEPADTTLARLARRPRRWDFQVGLGWSNEAGDPNGAGLPSQGHVSVALAARYMLTRAFGVGASLESHASGSSRFTAGSSGVSQFYADIPVCAEVTLIVPRNEGLRPYLKAGTGPYIFQHSVYVPSIYYDSYGHESSVRWGYNVGIGVEYRTGHYGFGLEAKGHNISRTGGGLAHLVSVVGLMHFH